MKNLLRGLAWGASYSVVVCTIIVAFTPTLNTYVAWVLGACTLLSFIIGVFLNLRANEIVCGQCNKKFRATSLKSRCPDCGWSPHNARNAGV
jgi:hypothetical protein